jgi:hypothetical protein
MTEVNERYRDFACWGSQEPDGGSSYADKVDWDRLGQDLGMYSLPVDSMSTARVPSASLGSKSCLRASQLCTKNSLDVCNFDYVTRFELFLAAFDHGIIHLDLYLVFRSSDEVAILGSVNQGCDGGSEPPL